MLISNFCYDGKQVITCCHICGHVTAVGSEYKIDASYLSPNVNLASRLEAATKQYSVPMLLSKDFVDCLSPSVRAKVGSRDTRGSSTTGVTLT